MPGIRDLHLGRLGLPTVKSPATKLIGSEVTNVGDATAVGQRRAKGFTLVFPIHATDGDPNLKLTGDRMRRQLTAMIQNHPLRFAGLYMNFAIDPEQNGWLVIGQGELAEVNGGVPFADYELSLSQVFLVASRVTHREGYRVDLTDLRAVGAPLDYDGRVLNLSSWFAGLSAFALTPLPVGASDVSVLSAPLATGSRSSLDGSCPICAGRSSGDVVSWERPEASLNLGDVVAYDRRGSLTAPTTSLDPQDNYGWEEIPGPDYPYNWLTAGQPIDAPVLTNGLCRVRYDPSNTPGFKVDVWTGAAWAEQGKVNVRRLGDTANFDATLVSAGVLEWTPDRSVVEAVMIVGAGDLYSRERVLITLQRGWTGPRFEIYTPPKSTGAGADAQFIYATATADTNNSAAKMDAGPAGAFAWTAGSGSALFPANTTIGAPSFNGENWVALLREGGSYQVNFAVLQADALAQVSNRTQSYGAARNTVEITSQSGAGYLSVHLGYCAQVADQMIEAESIRYASGTTSQVTDALASGGLAVKDTQTPPAAFTLSKSASSLVVGGGYRLFGRVKTDPGVTGGVNWGMENPPGYVSATFAVTSYGWVDLGYNLRTGVGGNPPLWLQEYRTAGSGSVYVDRLELVKVEDRASAATPCDGARDLGQSVLYDSRVQPRRVARGQS